MGQLQNNQVISADNLTAFITLQSKDPGKPLRFVPPSTPPPFEAKSLVLKRTDPTRLDAIGQQAMTLFSSFVFDHWEENKTRFVEDAKAILQSLSPAGTDYEVRTDVRPNRRFSGDGFLSPSRYNSLCQTADGHDGGTMRRELTAYHNPWTTGVLDVFDLTDPSAVGPPLFGPLPAEVVSEPRLALLISLPPFTATEHQWMRDAAKRWATTQVELPLSVTHVTFQRVVDLRVPRVAHWFTHNLTRLRWLNDDGIETPAFPNKSPLDEFIELLPTLAVQCLGGGNGAPRIAGQWLRSLGADALVYPSARSNSFVEVRNGDVSAFHGWNLVDYRKADPPRLQSSDLTPAWTQHVSNEVDEPPMAFYGNVVLQREESGRGAGSWSWQGMEEANFAQRVFLSAFKLYSWARQDASAAQVDEMKLMLGAGDSADAAARASASLVLALLGNVKARRVLLESISEALSPKEAQLVDLAGTFSRMDMRIADGKAGHLSKS
jgi:hypothetical protein